MRFLWIVLPKRYLMPHGVQCLDIRMLDIWMVLHSSCWTFQIYLFQLQIYHWAIDLCMCFCHQKQYVLIRTSFVVGTLLHQKYLDQCQIWTKARCYDDSCHTIPWSKRVLWKLETLSLFFISTKCILNCWRCVPWKSKFCLGAH